MSYIHDQGKNGVLDYWGFFFFDRKDNQDVGNNRGSEIEKEICSLKMEKEEKIDDIKK